MWLHRTTKAFIARASPATMAHTYGLVFVDANGKAQGNEEWIYQPDMAAVVGFESKYWIIVSDTVTLMSKAERDIVDVDEISDRRDAVVAEMDEVEGYIRAFALTVLDEVNTLRAKHSLADLTISQLKNAVRNKLGT